LNQYDLAAETFTSEPDDTPFNHVPNSIPLDNLNQSVASLKGLQREMALASARIDFSKPDAAPEDLLNHIIWWSVKGYNKPYLGEKTVKAPAFTVEKDGDDF
jgi:hypothetical protein